MTVVKATLVKRSTADGLVELWEDVPLGKTYEVVLESRRRITLYSLRNCVMHEKEVIDDVNGRWLPVECLAIEAQEQN